MLAPILADPTETRTIGGREYEIFADAGKIKLVAWHRTDAFAQLGAEQLDLIDLADDDAVPLALERHLLSYAHMVGTCPMGPVLDADCPRRLAAVRHAAARARRAGRHLARGPRAAADPHRRRRGHADDPVRQHLPRVRHDRRAHRRQDESADIDLSLTGQIS